MSNKSAQKCGPSESLCYMDCMEKEERKKNKTKTKTQTRDLGTLIPKIQNNFNRTFSELGFYRKIKRKDI